jgi:hypothetical protein
VVILHTFLALAAGFAVLVLLGMGLTALIARMAPDWTAEAGPLQPRPPSGDLYPMGWKPSYAFVNLGSSYLSAAAGGYTTAWSAAANPLIHTLALGIVVLALAALSALQSKGKLPVWFLMAQVAIAPLGVLAGGLVRLRVLGIL